MKSKPSKTISELSKQLMDSTSDNPFSLSLVAVQSEYDLPAMQSFAYGSHGGEWIAIGGQIAGFHGTANDPPPFMRLGANEKLWVLDLERGKSYSTHVPMKYYAALAGTNQQFYQVGESLYLCGGYTVGDSSQTRNNTTSNAFFRIDIPSFIQYVKSGGISPSLDLVFPIAINDDHVRVTGGEMIVVNDIFYLVGGQDFEGEYNVGSSGKYTNAIRSFKLQQNGLEWSIVPGSELVDAENLHRRDMNLLPFVTSDNSMNAIILGGVFTSDDLSYNNPVFINGLETGQPSIAVSAFEQKCNQYTCASIPFLIAPGLGMLYGLLGGITYMLYSPVTQGLVVGDNGMPMPFSNLIDFVVSDGSSYVEHVQVPPKSLLPNYLGSNAAFLPSSKYLSDDFHNILDLSKVLSDESESKQLGYLFGGIVSDGPTSGTTPKGHINTYANPTLYKVELSIQLD